MKSVKPSQKAGWRMERSPHAAEQAGSPSMFPGGGGARSSSEGQIWPLASDPWHPGARRAPSHVPAALTPPSAHATSSRCLSSNPNSAITTVPPDTVNVNNCMASFCYLVTSCLFPMFYCMFVVIRCPWAFRKAPIHKIEDLTTKRDTCAQVLCYVFG